MKIKKYQKTDFESLWEVISLSFGASEKEKEMAKKEIGYYNGWYIFEDEKPVSAVFYFPWTMNFGDRQLISAGICYVCTLPEYRNRGYVKTLFKEMLVELHKKGIPFTSLYAFKMEYYRMMGYGSMVQCFRYEFDPQKVPVLPDQKYSIEYLDKKDWKKFTDYYNRAYFKKFNGSLKKIPQVEEFYEHWALNKGGMAQYKLCLVKNAKGEPKGMFGLGIKREKEAKFFDIFWEDRKAFLTIMRYMGTFRDQVKKINAVVSEDRRFEYFLNTLYFDQKVATRQMGRILNICEFVKFLRLEKGKYQLALKDEIINENNGIFEIISDGKSIKCKLIDKNPGTGAVDISLFSEFVFLENSFEFHKMSGLVPQKTAKLLSAIENRQVSFVTEFY